MNKFTAQRDETGLDFFPWRVNLHAENSSRMLCRCGSREDAELIANALSGRNTMQAALSDVEVIAKIDRVLASLSSTKSAPDKKIRVVL